MEELKSMFSKIGKNITKTSADIIKNTKLNIELSSQEEKLKNIYWFLEFCGFYRKFI